MARPTGKHRELACNGRVIAAAVNRIKKQKSEPGEYRILGVRGVVLLVLSSGTATWYFHYDQELGGKRKRRKLKLGRLDDISLADAVAKADEFRPMVNQGLDPARTSKPSSAAPTFADLAKDRFDNGDPLRPGTLNDYAIILNRDILAKIGDLPATSVRRQHVLEIVDSISKRGATRRADIARVIISSIYGFGLDRGIVEHNPALNIRSRHDYEARTVIATEDEIRLILSTLDTSEAPMSKSLKDIIHLALLTGQRRVEIAGARKEELDLVSANPTLTISRGRAKNRRLNRVPLSREAREIFSSAVAASDHEKFVFPAPHKDAHIAPRSVTQAMERLRTKTGIQDLTVHDLRRTAGSYLSKYGVPKDIRARVLNHTGHHTRDVTDSVYNSYEYDIEKRAALELWADALDAIRGNGSAEILDYNARLLKLKGSGRIRIG